MKKMKLYKFFAIIGLTAILSLPSCNDYEDVPIERFTIEYVFSRTDSMGTKAKEYLVNIYAIMPYGHNRIGNEYLDAASDDATSIETSSDVYRLQVNRYTAHDRVTQDMIWGDYYKGIRKCNTFIENIDIVPLKDKFNGGIPLNRAWKAEARFLRAYFYFELIKRYGGVPMVNEIYELGADMELPRNTFEECVDFILDEVEAIKDSLRTLPVANTDADGHVVTKEAAMAFKSRVLLYAASPLFNGKTLEKGNPLLGYTDESATRWKDAADAAKWFIDTYGPDGQAKFELSPYFGDVFLNYYGLGTKEVIFFRASGRNKTLENNSGPAGFTGQNLAKGYNSPTQNLVDAFPMLDGKPIGKSDKYDYSDETMYEKRDPRLDSTVLHNGSLWLTTNLATYEGGTHKPTNLTLKTVSSYYVRKFLGRNEVKPQYEDALHVWVMFRYAEMLLNYAEAQNEFGGPLSSATGTVLTPIDAIKQIRKRAGIEPGTDNMYGLDASMDKDQMREIIQNERRIELAFEEHRYWDIRRWKIAGTVFNEPLKGLVIIRNAGKNEINRVNLLTVNFNEKKNYLYPIPYTEVIKNRNMIQNPEWD